MFFCSLSANTIDCSCFPRLCVSAYANYASMLGLLARVNNRDELQLDRLQTSIAYEAVVGLVNTILLFSLDLFQIQYTFNVQVDVEPVNDYTRRASCIIT